MRTIEEMFELGSLYPKTVEEMLAALEDVKDDPEPGRITFTTEMMGDICRRIKELEGN